ncbi:uncharacterized protein LOC131066502 [Cryptomeria japonica]|uniref:uncharacterized protein LOC131066502 n=1 Tax=Cryptomeria japonica TaxID=3369 RepID=UPI0027DA2279|nr:uncharacterized protein LOC131066502 [Cryptomeria japonica]
MRGRVLTESYTLQLYSTMLVHLNKSIGGINIYIKQMSFKFPITFFSARSGASRSSKRVEPSTCAKCQKGEIYTTLHTKASAELEIKRSKFIALAAPVSDEEAAFNFLNQVRDPRATHNCWGYKIGDMYRFNDDGEPVGKAGRPIHSAIVASGLDRVMVVVIRYFGGIKLGAGGLVRAYGGVASDCLRDAPSCLVKSKVAVTLEVPFDFLGNIYSLIQSYQVANLEHEYDKVGNGINYIRFEVDFDEVDMLELNIKSSCSGQVSISRI